MEVSQADEKRYLAALRRHGAHPVVMESDVTTLAVLVGAVQLALRHPAFPRTSRVLCARWIAQAAEQLAPLDPVLEEGVHWGNERQRDVPHNLGGAADA